MAHFKKLPQKKNEDKIIYSDGIVDGIVLLALEEVPCAELYSITSHKSGHNGSIKVFFDKDGVHVDVKVKIHFTQCVSDMAFKIQETIRHNIESMTNYRVAGVNVIVKGVLFDENANVTNGEQNVVTDEAPAEAESVTENIATVSVESDKDKSAEMSVPADKENK